MHRHYLSQRFVLRCTQLLCLTRTASSFSTTPLSVPRRAFSSFSTLLFASPTRLTFGASLLEEDVSKYNATLVIGKKESIEQVLPNLLEPLGLDMIQKPVLDAMISTLNNKTGGSSTTLVALEDDDVHKVSLAGLPSKSSRNNHPMAVHTLTKCAGAAKGDTRIVVMSDDFAVGPLASAIAKAFPLFSKKSKPGTDRKVHVVFCKSDGSLVDDEEQLKASRVVASGVQLAARLVDSHPELLTTTQFAKEVEALVADHPKVQMKQIIGEELRPYGGLYGVGKAATCPPRMILLEYDGGDSDETVALVGKGIVYDTGGLSLKSGKGMCGMKQDMGGAAGLFGGFWGAVQLGVKKKVYCILCLAENSIGPTAFRNDDILDMYSGKTVEVNNCDAEGRLVLADGVAHATKHIENLDLVVDMATLTGAQLVATGKKHAGILCNKEEVESRAMEAGMHSGDLCFPLLYAPELLMDEFKSEVADMKNSVKDRGNAQTSCAGHFIEAHLEESYEGGWLHVDMAGPGTKGQRGTGYGVGLVLSLLKAPGF
jgi:probable aminopeptidase NPEPL1